MTITITGTNAHLMRQRLNKLMEDFVAEYGDLALEKLDGEEIEPNQLLDAVQNLPFLSAKKMVVAYNISANKTVAESIEQIISAAHEAVDIIFYEPHIDKRTGYYKSLKAKTNFEEFVDLDAAGLANWLEDEANILGATLARSDASYLVARVGANQNLLFNELNKLATYNPQITKESIDLLTEKTPQSKIFDLLDAAFAKDKTKALQIYDEQRAQKVEPQEIIAMFAWQLRLIVAVKFAGDKLAGEIARDLKMSPFPVTKAMSLARKLDQEKIINIVNEITDIDMRGKTKPINLDEALRTFILSL